jgi:hypothetical protein
LKFVQGAGELWGMHDGWDQFCARTIWQPLFLHFIVAVGIHEMETTVMVFTYRLLYFGIVSSFSAKLVCKTSHRETCINVESVGWSGSSHVIWYKVNLTSFAEWPYKLDRGWATSSSLALY